MSPGEPVSPVGGSVSSVFGSTVSSVQDVMVNALDKASRIMHMNFFICVVFNCG